MIDLHLEISRRNARLRAWRANGVPVEGGWALQGGAARLTLRCGACGITTGPSSHGKSCTPPPPPGASSLARRERFELRHLEAIGCSHLSPLAGSDPPAVIAVYELELLAVG
jgi:hypothetical protein